MSTTKINQHYVPELILKEFAVKGRVSVYDSKRDMARHNTLPKKVFFERYFYGKDALVENFLAEEIEAPAKPHFERIVREARIDHNFAPPKEMLRFLLVQLSRTPSSVTGMLDVFGKYSRTIIRQIGDLNGIPPEVSQNVTITLTDPKAIMNKMIARSVLMSPLISDLGQFLLINNTVIPFVISDHPVTHYNWYYRDSEDPSRTSFTAKGLQIFLPISPKLTLCLYDKGVYKFNNSRSSVMELGSEEDVHLLNTLQAMTREDMVIFQERSSESYVRSLCTEYSAGSLHSSEADFTAARDVGNNRLASEHSVWRSQAKLRNWLSFVSIRRNARATKHHVLDRQPNLVAAHHLAMRAFNG